MTASSVDDRARTVFVVHGRNKEARRAIFAFLRSIGLRPLEWTHARGLTGVATPYIGQVLDSAFANAQAVVVLLSPDEVVHLRPEYASSADDPELQPGLQARPNVLFEAGMAMGRDPSRTIMVELGSVRPFSDVAGRHAVHLSNTPAMRNELAMRLRTAGCVVDLSGSDWLEAGDFHAPPPPRSTTIGLVTPPTLAANYKNSDPKDLPLTGGLRLSNPSLPTREQLVAKQPNKWEYFLWSSLLLDGKERLEGKWHKHEERTASPSDLVLNHESIRKFPNRILDALKLIIDRINLLFKSEAKARALGDLGEVGDPVAIDALANEYLAIYEELMDWSARIRGGRISGKYVQLADIGAQIYDMPITLMRSFVEDFADGMSKFQAGEPVDLQLTLTLDLDSAVLDKFLQEYRRVM